MKESTLRGMICTSGMAEKPETLTRLNDRVVIRAFVQQIISNTQRQLPMKESDLDSIIGKSTGLLDFIMRVCAFTLAWEIIEDLHARAN